MNYEFIEYDFELLINGIVPNMYDNEVKISNLCYDGC